MFKYIAIILGVLILAGTAGSSDLDPMMPMSQILLQSVVGLLLFISGVIVSLEEQKI